MSLIASIDMWATMLKIACVDAMTLETSSCQ